MEKEKIMNDIKFRQKCCKFGLNWSDFEILRGLIVLKTSAEDLYLFLDNHYNVVTIKKCFVEPDDDICEIIRYRYANYTGEIPSDIDTGYLFDEFSLKQIADISNRVNIIETNHGHSTQIEINGEFYENDPDNHYLQLISYIKFLHEQIKLFWENTYTLTMLDFEVPDVYSYLRKIIIKINECIDINLKDNKRPHPMDIMNYIGQTEFYSKEIEKMNSLLYNVIDLLIKERGMKSKNGTLYQLECISEEEKLPPLSTLAHNVLKILEVSDEQVLENKQRYSEENVAQRVKTLNKYLSEDINQ